MDDKNRRRLMWFGVGVTIFAVFALWIWSLELQFTFFSWDKSPEGILAQQTKSNWDKAFADNKHREDELESAKNKIQNFLNQLSASTTTPTTTTGTAAVTTSSVVTSTQ